MIVPFLWMLTTALKSNLQAYLFPPEWIPEPFVWGNFSLVWNILPIGRFMVNSAVVAVSITIGQVLFASMAAYAFARLKFPFRNQIFIAYLATMMIPYHVVLIPVYILVNQLEWVDTYQGIIVPNMFSAFATFFLRQFFMTIPEELEDAAKIDGASYLRVFWQIILPLSKPALATIGIFVFMFGWNDFLWPLVVINSLDKTTLPVGLAFFRGEYVVYWNLMMVATTIAVIPVLIVFLFAQRYFVQGIALTGIKD